MSDLGVRNAAEGAASRAFLPSRLQRQRISAFPFIKRGCDIALSVALLLPVGIICFVVWCVNAWLNPGKLFFTQMRIGRNERPFRILKLRTMTGAAGDARFATDEAHRITRFGAMLRSKRIDELPQVINILLGHMSFIGPRPEQPNFYQTFSETIAGYRLRQNVRPGLSGLAQVAQGYADDASSTRTKLRYDMHYIRNMGFRMELYVLVQTVRVVLTGYGAR
ncbi:MAG: sugar transferase [Pseudomonadota bacterium]